MRIVNLETLRSMPQGTLFQKFAPDYFRGFAIFDGPLGERDFVVLDFGDCPIEGKDPSDVSYKLFEMSENGASYPVGLEMYGRDGCFDDEQLFAVWEADDVRRLIAKLQEGLPPT